MGAAGVGRRVVVTASVVGIASAVVGTTIVVIFSVVVV